MTTLPWHGSRRESREGLEVLALSYLAIPNFIFLFGWFKLPFALILVCTLLYLLHLASNARQISWHFGYTPTAGVLIAVTALVWAAFGGGSHFMHANHDWIIRDAVMGDLIHSEWPVSYKTPDTAPLILRSAIGYFLPPALFGKLAGTEYLDLAVYLWTAAGVLIFLALLPLPRKAGWPLALGLAVTVFFGGMDFLGTLIATQSLPIFPLRLEWWVPLSYPSLTGQLLWAPNHCLPIWIGILLVYRHRDGNGMLPMAAALLPLTLIWTPFAVIGLSPFVLLGAWKSLRSQAIAALPWRSITACMVYSLPVTLFLLLDIGGITASSTVQAQANPPQGVAHQDVSLNAYAIFVSCEFLLLAMALAPNVKEAKGFFAMAVALLLLLPIVRFGPSNDVLLRLSTPSLIVLLVVALSALLTADRIGRHPTQWVAWIFLIIGGATAFNELWRSATFNRWKADYRQTLAERQGGLPANHYAGRLDSTIVRMLLIPPGNGRPIQKKQPQ